MAQPAIDPAQGSITERRISWLTLTIGFAAALAAAYFRGRAWGVGLAAGAALAWLNFRWLRRGLDALVTASTAQSGREKPLVPLSSYFLALFRYALIGLTVYVIFTYLHVPLLSLIVGLCALGAAAIAASVYEILIPTE
jgi:small-conductance mechanosensitive channel